MSRKTIKWMLIEIEPFDGPLVFVASPHDGFDNHEQALRYRTEYLKKYPKIEPQNIQIIQYVEAD